MLSLDMLLLATLLLLDMPLLPSELLMLPSGNLLPEVTTNQCCHLRSKHLAVQPKATAYLFNVQNVSVQKAHFLEFLWFSHADPSNFDPGETRKTRLFGDAQF